jgi:ornithine carbamoyltransferase
MALVQAFKMAPSRLLTSALRSATRLQTRAYTGRSSLSNPRHLLSTKDLTPEEFSQLVLNASGHKFDKPTLCTDWRLKDSLTGKVVAMLFSKKSTRTRVSTEGAAVAMGGHPMFLGKDDIQLGVNESLYDTSVVISSMVSCIVARVNAHKDVAQLAEHSSVPVINALCDTYHPLQMIADYLTMFETFAGSQSAHAHISVAKALSGLQVAWIGDANNVLFDMCISARKIGVNIAVATPKGYEIPGFMKDIIEQAGAGVQSPGKITETDVPEEAVKNADVIVTDTWVSMGQEGEKAKRLKAFEGFQITSDLAKRGGAKGNWKFMHCLPRHQEEVSDEVFYGPRSLVFPEAENRLWAAISALEGFVVNKGNIV